MTQVWADYLDPTQNSNCRAHVNWNWNCLDKSSDYLIFSIKINKLLHHNILVFMNHKKLVLVKHKLLDIVKH